MGGGYKCKHISYAMQQNAASIFTTFVISQIESVFGLEYKGHEYSEYPALNIHCTSHTIHIIC